MVEVEERVVMMTFANMRMLTSYLIYIVLIHQCLAQTENECEIHGLPQSTLTRKGNIYFLHYNLPSKELSLSCRCSIYQPLWQVYELETPDLLVPFSGDETCMNTTSGQPCDDEGITFIRERKPGIVLYNDATFIINQSKMLMCYSAKIRQAVVVILSDPAKNVTVASTATTSTSSSSDSLYFHSSTEFVTTIKSLTALFSTTKNGAYTLSPSVTPSASATFGSSSLTPSIILSTSTSVPIMNVVTTLINSFQPTDQVTLDGTHTVVVFPVEGDTIMEKIGISTLVVVPMFIVVLVISVLLCILVIHMRSKYHSRDMEIKHQNLSIDHVQQGNRLIPPLVNNNNHNRKLSKSQSALTYINSYSLESVESV